METNESLAAESFNKLFSKNAMGSMGVGITLTNMGSLQLLYCK